MEIYKKIFSKKGKTLIVVIAILIILSLCLCQRDSAAGSSSKNSFYSISQPLQKGLWKLGDGLSDFFEGFSRSKDLKRKNEELERRYQELLAETALLHNLKEENEMLKKALDIGLQEEFQLVLADLVSKDASRDFVLINKGSKDNLSAEMPVITEQKVLLGKIGEVHEDFSRVVLISNKESLFPAEVQEAETRAIIKGKGNFQVSLEEIPQDKEVKEGNIVITCALGGDFPKGLLIGEVKNIKKSDIETFQKAEISPFFNIEELKSIFIITSF